MAALNARMGADFSDFVNACAKAEIAIKGVGSGSEKVGASLTRMANSFSGTKIIQDAQLTVAAVDRLGGASTLTAKEMARVNSTVNEAIAKYKALGGQAPQSMLALADATKQTSQHVGFLDGAVGKMVVALSAANLIQKGASMLMDMGRQAFVTAGTLVDLSNKTGLSTETLQRMQFVAKQSGSDMGAFADAAFKMGVNVEKGTKNAREGADLLGLSWKDLRAASPDQQFNMVVAALEAMEDPQKRNTAAVLLFDKTAKTILPAIVDGYTKIAAQATVAGEAQVKAVDATGDAWDRFKTKTGTAFVSAVGSVILLREAMATLTKEQRDFVQQTLPATATTDDFSAALIKASQAKKKAADVPLPFDGPAVTATASFTEQLAKATAEVGRLTVSQRAGLDAAQKLGASTEDITNEFGISEGALKLLKEQTDKHEASQKKAASAIDEHRKKLDAVNQKIADATRDVGKLTEAQKASVRQYSALSLSNADIALKMNVSEGAVKKFNDELKDHEDALKAADGIAKLFTSEGNKHWKEWGDETKKQLGTVNQLVVTNFTDRLAAQKVFDDEVAQRTMTSYDFQKKKIADHLADQKVALETKGGNWKAAFELDTKVANDAINAIEWKKIQDDIDATDEATAEWVAKSEKHFDDLAGALGSLSNDFVQLSQIAGDTWGGPLQAIGQTIKAVEMVTSGIHAIGTAMQSIQEKGFNVSNLAGMAKGWMAVATAAYMYYQWIQKSVEAGKVANELKTLQFLADELAKSFHNAEGFSDQLIQSFRDGDTVASHLNDIIDEMGGTAHMTAEQLRAVEGVMAGIIVSGKRTWQEVEQLDDALVRLGDGAVSSTGLVTDFFIKSVNAAKDYGVELAGVNDFILGQLGDAAEGLNELIGGMTKGLGDSFKVTADQAAGLGAAAAATFADMVQRGMSIGDALKALDPMIDDMTEALKRSGVDGGAAFDFLTEMARIAGHEIMGPMSDAITGASKALKGLHNSGILNQQMFTGLELTAMQAYNKIISEGGDANAALMMMQPTLQTLWSLQRDFGYEVDATTQALIDEAVATGKVGDKHRPMAEQMLLATQGIERAVTALAKVFGVDLPASAEDGAKRVSTALQGIKGPPPIDAPWAHWEAPPDFGGGGGGTASVAAAGGIVTDRDIQRFAGGGTVLNFRPRGSDTVPAMLTPGEMVLTQGQQRGLLGSVAEVQALRDEVRGLRADIKNQAREQDRRIGLAVATGLQLKRRAS